MKRLLPLVLTVVATLLIGWTPVQAQEGQYVWWDAEDVALVDVEDKLLLLEECMGATRPEGELLIYSVRALIAQQMKAGPDGYQQLTLLGGFFHVRGDGSYLVVYTRGQSDSEHTLFHELFHYVTGIHDGPMFEILLADCVGPDV
jgi:hypothetical protein